MWATGRSCVHVTDPPCWQSLVDQHFIILTPPESRIGDQECDDESPRGEEGQSCFVRDDMIWVDVVVVRVVRRKCNNRESSGTKKPKSEAPSEWYALITGVHTDWPTLSPFPVTTCSNCSWLETLAWASRVCCFVFRWVPVKWLAFMVIIISNLYIRLFQDDTYTESYISTIGVDFVSTS